MGCQLTYQVRDNRILRVEGRDGPANHGRLCIKGRYGFDYVHHPQRLTRPLIRRDDAPKDSACRRRAAAITASSSARPRWEEAMERAAAGFRAHSRQARRQALAGFGSAKGSNEEAYLFQKLIRTGFGTNNVDHCTRLCHASSVAALLQMIGSGAVSNPVADVADAEVIVVIGSNTTENHPVAATFMKNAARAGKTLIVMDPRRTPLARHAHYYLQFRPDTDVALLECPDARHRRERLDRRGTSSPRAPRASTHCASTSQPSAPSAWRPSAASTPACCARWRVSMPPRAPP